MKKVLVLVEENNRNVVVEKKVEGRVSVGRCTIDVVVDGN